MRITTLIEYLETKNCQLCYGDDVDEEADLYDIGSELLYCDPDYVRVDGKTYAFIAIPPQFDGDEIHVVFRFEDVPEKAYKIIEAFYADELEPCRINEPSWDKWDKVNDGLAHRGGVGYTYALYDLADFE